MNEETSRCACGADKPEVRIGCDDCEKAARLLVDWQRPTPTLPPGWWRIFEPEYSCGPYYLFGRERDGEDHDGRPKRDKVIVEACSLGVSLDETYDMRHLSAGEARAFTVVLHRAADDHLALKESERDDALSEMVARAAKFRAALLGRPAAENPERCGEGWSIGDDEKGGFCALGPWRATKKEAQADARAAGRAETVQAALRAVLGDFRCFCDGDHAPDCMVVKLHALVGSEAPRPKLWVQEKPRRRTKPKARASRRRATR